MLWGENNGKLTPYTLSWIFQTSFWSYGHLAWSVFPLLLQDSTGHLSHGFFQQYSWGSWPQLHQLISKLKMVRAFRPANVSPKWTVYIARIAAPTKFLHPFVLKRREMAQSVLTKALLQPAKRAAMCMACHEYACPPPLFHLFCLHKTFPIPSFLLTQNLPYPTFFTRTKQIVPTDNIQICMTSTLIISCQRVKHLT